MCSRNPSGARPTLRFGITKPSANLEFFFLSFSTFFNADFSFVKRLYTNLLFYIKNESVQVTIMSNLISKYMV